MKLNKIEVTALENVAGFSNLELYNYCVERNVEHIWLSVYLLDAKIH